MTLRPLQSSKAGSVIWINNDSAPHTVTSGNPDNGQLPRGAIFDSGILGPGQSSEEITINADELERMTILYIASVYERAIDNRGIIWCSSSRTLSIFWSQSIHCNCPDIDHDKMVIVRLEKLRSPTKSLKGQDHNQFQLYSAVPSSGGSNL